MTSDSQFPESERLAFRAWRDDDMALAMALWGDPRVTALIDSRGVLDRSTVEARLREQIELADHHGIQYWPAFLMETLEFAGCAGLRPRVPENRIFELGFHICARFWGQGLATEAALSVARFAFTELDAMALFAGHNPNNRASAHVLEKLGFRHTHDEAYAPTGLLHPSYLLTAEEFAKR